MYVCGLVIPVPAAREDQYRRWAADSAAVFARYGCLEVVESWEDNVPSGQRTDFRRAVAAEPDERLVFTWQVWPDKEPLDAAEARMHADGVLDGAGAPPFDAGRLILGCFRPISVWGRKEARG